MNTIMSATISLVIITYNRAPFLSAAIESVLKQTKSDFELLIWDDGSTDESLEIARNYAKKDRRIRVIAGEHRGETPARKAAMAEITGAYFGWVDSDDLLAPTALEETVPILDAHPEVGFVYTDYIDISENEEVLGYGKRCRIPYSKERLLLDFMTFHFRLIRRSAFEKAGGIDEEIQDISDYDLCVRLSEVAEVKHLSKPLYYYRNHPKSLSKSRPMEVIQNSHQMMTKALKRRGMSDRFFIDLQLHQINGQIQARFSLVSKELTHQLANVTPIKKKKEKSLAFSFLLSSLALIGGNPAFAQPIVPAKDGTNTIVNPQGNRFDITGGQRSGDGGNLFHSFTRFGLSSQQTANFLSQPNIRNILARINGGEVSYINGLIRVTGGNSNLFLMNPSGIVFGQNASLNVPAAFTATTANGIGLGSNWFNATGNNNYAALVGNPNAFAFPMQQPGAIINSGSLEVGLGQNLTLLAGTVVNTGQLTAPQGNITVAAVPGSSLVRLSQPGFLLSLEVQPIGNSATQPNNFNLPIASLPQMLTGRSGGNATGVQVNQDGSVELTGSGIRIPTGGNTAIVSGNIDVSGKTGGNVNIVADKVGVISANINASGSNGGGQGVRIGGDYQGKGTLPNASRTVVSKDTVISADSLIAGNGGKVIVWSDKTTEFYGSISAKGGSNSGDGGFVEVSGKEFLDFQGKVNTLAPNGNTGMLLLDPTSIEIIAGTGYSTGFFTDLTQVDQFADPDGNPNTINAALINAATTNVTLQATNNITFNAPVNITAKGVGITAEAKNNIQVNQDITTNGGAVTLSANVDNNFGGELVINNATIKTGGGNFTGTGTGYFSNAITLNNSTINTEGGNIQLTGNGSNFSGSGYTGISLLNSSLQTKGAGNITLNGTGGNGDGIQNRGIYLEQAVVEVTGTGTITLTGTAGNGTDENVGIYLNTNSKVSANNGNISFTGIGNGSGERNRGIELQNAALVQTTGTGTITLTGTGANAKNDDAGIFVNLNAKVTSNNGNVNLTGIGGKVGNNSNGVWVNNGGVVESTGIGKVSLTGTGGNGTDFNSGVNINGANSQVNANNGGISIKGTGGSGTGNENNGVQVITGGVVTVTGTGNITINGKGGNAAGFNSGIIISDVGSKVSSQDGNIQLIGVAGDGSDSSNIGIRHLNGAVLEATGTGGITLDGTGGSGINFNAGIVIGPNNGVSPRVSTNNGDINVSGKGGNGTGNTNIGIQFDGNGTLLEAKGSGKITFNGTGGNGINENYGIRIVDSSIINAAKGITFIGNGGKVTGTGRNGIFLNNGVSLQITDTGDINLTGTGINGAEGINITNSFVKSDVTGNGNVTLTADEITLAGTTQISGKGIVRLQPLTPSLDITVGGAIQDGRLNLDGSEIATLQDGFSQIVIGRDNSTGAIALLGNVTFKDPVKLQSPEGAGSINTSGFTITGNDNVSVTLLANQDIKTGNITAPSGITITSKSSSINSSAGKLDSSNSSGKGAISLDAAGNITTADINTTTIGSSNAGNISLVSGGSIDTKAGKLDSSAVDGTSGTIALNAKGNIATGSVVYSGSKGSGTAATIDLISSGGAINTTLTQLDSGAAQSNGGNITLNANGDITTGTVIYSGSAGSGTGGKINLTSTNGGINTTAGKVESGSTNGNGGDISFSANGDITTGTVIYSVGSGTGGKINLTSTNGGINTTAGKVESGSTNGNGGDISFSANSDITTGTVIYSGSAGSGTGGKINLTSTNGAIDTSLGTVDSRSVSGTGGAISLEANGKITTANVNSNSGGAGNGGAISVNSKSGAIDTIAGTLDASSQTGNGGAIALSGKGNISTGTINLGSINSTLGGGDLKINTPEIVNINGAINSNGANIFVGETNAASQINLNFSSGSLTTKGGNITMKSLGALDISKDLLTAGGTISLTGATINSKTGSLDSSNIANNGGVITLSATGNINTSNLISKSSGAGNGGDITVTSTGGGIDTSTGSIDASSVSGSGGKVSLIAPKSLTVGAINSTGLPGTGNISLTSDKISFTGVANSLQGKGNLLLQPFTFSENLDISTVNFNVFAEGFKSITIGSEQGSGVVTIQSAIAFSDPVIIQSPDGKIVVNGAITGTDDASITLNGKTNLNADITTAEQNINLKGNVTLGNNLTLSTGAKAGGDIVVNGTIDGNKNLTLETGIGNINLNGAVGSITPIGDLTINSANNLTATTITAASITQKAGTGITSFGDLNTNTAQGINLIGNSFAFKGNVTTTNNGGFIIDNNSPLDLATSTKFNLDGAFKQIGQGAVSLATNITTTNDDISFKSPVTLTADASLNTGDGIGDITFNSTVDGGKNLNLNAGIGNINFVGVAGGVTRLGNLTINNAKDVNAASITAISISQKSGSGSTNLGTLDTNSSQGINLTGNNFKFDGKVTTSNSGGVTINNSGSLTITNVADMFLDGAFNQVGNGAVSTAGDIATNNNNISFNSPVILTDNIALNTNTGAGDITFANTVDGASNLTLSAGTGNINFKGAVGNANRLGILTINNATNVTANSIKAASIIQAAGNGTTSLGSLDTNSSKGISLTGSNFSLNGNAIASGSGGLTINNNGVLSIGAVDIKLDGSFKQIGTGNVFTAGNITTNNNDISFTSPVNLKGDVSLNTGDGIGDINFNSPVDGTQNIFLNAGIGNINFAKAVGSNTRLGTLNIVSAKDVNAASIRAASIIQNSGSGTSNLGALDTNSPAENKLTGNNFNLNGAVTTSNNGGLTINNKGSLNIAADLKLDGALNQIGTGGVFTAGNITTTNDDIRFNGFVTLTGNTTFNPGTGAIAFNSGLLSGNNPLTLRAGEIIFGGPVSGNGTLVLEPANPEQNIAIADTISGAFNLSATTLANLQNGFSSITIGRTDSTGTVTVKDVTFKDPLTIRSGNGAINVDGAITGQDNASITLDSAITKLNANITTANQNITIGRVIQLGTDLTISTGLGAGDITFTGAIDGTKQLNLAAGTGNIRFNAAAGANSPLGKLNITSANNVFISQGINTANSDLTINAPVTLTNNAALNTGGGNINFGSNVDSEIGKANDLTLTAGTGNITFNGAVGSGQGIGNLSIVSAKDLTAASTIQARQLQHKEGTGNINLQGNFVTSAGGVELNTSGNIRTINITANGGNITANSKNGRVETGNLTAVSTTGIGNTITLTAPQAVTTGNLLATGVDQGGTVIVKSGDRITTKNIDVSATIGNGGTVILDPPNDIQVGFINAQGGTQGTGGLVDITTASLFRATESFIDNKGVNSSISTAGGTGNGSIIIRHGGGNLKTPFIVGNATKNGTAAALTTGANIIAPTQSFPGSVTLGNIQIITQDQPPVPPIPPEFPGNADKPTDKISGTPPTLITAIPSVPIDSVFQVTEQNFTQEFEAYFGRKFTENIKSLSEIRDQLIRNEQQTGIRSALLYIVFGRAQQGTQALVTCPPETSSTTDTNKPQQQGCQKQDNDKVELFILTPEGEPVRFPIPNVSKAQIISLARQLQMEVTDKSKLDTTSYLAPAQELYKMLIAPIEGELEKRGIKNLIFIPDAGLRSLPVAALHDGKGFIVEKYSVSLMPSFSLSNPRYFNLKNSTVLAMGASKFTEQAPLPAVPVELSTIANQLWSGKISINEDFTVDNLKTQRATRTYDIVHLATHAEFRPGAPSNSYIQFWDSRLGLDKMRSLQWNKPPVQLLVLSACRTALGDKQVELGFAGLAVQSGVQSTLASLWYVSDQGTLGLMTEFYEQLKTAPIRAEALRKAQLAMIHGEVFINNNQLEGVLEKGGILLPPELQQSGKMNFSHPYYWAAFTLIGNPW